MVLFMYNVKKIKGAAQKNGYGDVCVNEIYLSKFNCNTLVSYPEGRT